MKTFALMITALLFTHAARADLITFDFRNDPDVYGLLDEKASDTAVSLSGVTATFSPSTGDTLNQTTKGFGVNAAASGDDTDAFNIGEYMTVSFSTNVLLTSVTVSSWGDNNEGLICVGETCTNTLTSTGTHTFDDITIESGTLLKFSCSQDSNAGNGWSLDSFVIQTIPEPATVTLLLSSGLSLLVARRFVS